MTEPLKYITGLWNAEDFAVLPGGRWVVTTGLAGPGRPAGQLGLIDAGTKVHTTLFPGRATVAPLGAPYETSPPDPTVFDAHGLSLRVGERGVHRLYVVNHGGREAIELFDVDTRPEVPAIAWVGAVLQQDGVWGNAVAALPEGGFAATNYLDQNDPDAFEKVYAGLPTGNVKEWHESAGWTDLPGTEASSPNGLTVSPDGQWLFICSWSARRVIRVSRGGDAVQRDEVSVGFMPDNAKWHESGILIAGQHTDPRTLIDDFFAKSIAVYPYSVARIDAVTLDVTTLVHGSDEHFGTAATGYPVGEELWMSNARGDRIAYLPWTG